jgi:very-short-patch-repair endonuclease
MGQFHFFTTAELRAQGHTIQTIRDSIEAGDLERVVRGWHAVRQTDRTAVRAMRLGGRLSCVSALGMHGAWVPPDQGVHLLMPSHASGRRLAHRTLPDNHVAHWQAKADHTGSAFPIAPLEMAVGDMIECQEPHFAIATLDSLLFRRLMLPNRLRAAIAHGPLQRRFLLDHLEPRSEEGIESITRFLLAAAGIRCEVQVTMKTGDRVDLLIDGWLVLELDGRETHAQQAAFTHDRVRAARLTRDGRMVLQFAYASIIYDWPFVLETIRSVMAQHAPIH